MAHAQSRLYVSMADICDHEPISADYEPADPARPLNHRGYRFNDPFAHYNVFLDLDTSTKSFRAIQFKDPLDKFRGMSLVVQLVIRAKPHVEERLRRHAPNIFDEDGHLQTNPEATKDSPDEQKRPYPDRQTHLAQLLNSFRRGCVAIIGNTTMSSGYVMVPCRRWSKKEHRDVMRCAKIPFVTQAWELLGHADNGMCLLSDDTVEHNLRQGHFRLQIELMTVLADEEMVEKEETFIRKFCSDKREPRDGWTFTGFTQNGRTVYAAKWNRYGSSAALVDTSSGLREIGAITEWWREVQTEQKRNVGRDATNILMM